MSRSTTSSALPTAPETPWGLRRLRPYPPITGETGYASICLDPDSQVTAYLDPAGSPVALPVAETTTSTRSVRPTNQDGKADTHPILDTARD